MTAQEILEAMKPLGRESYKRVLVHNYGVKEPCFGVPIGELKKFQKRKTVLCVVKVAARQGAGK